MTVLIFTNGNYEEVEFYRDLIYQIEEPYFICADGGGNFARKLGVFPDVLLGDMDSIDKETLEAFRKAKVYEFPKKKDETDTELGIQYAINLAKEKKIKKVILLGAIGNRMDHTLGNIYLLSRFLDLGILGEIINKNNHMFLINKETDLALKPGTLISLLPLGEEVQGINISGFEYGIENGDMTLRNPYGISNVVTETKQKISMKKGIILVNIPNE